MRLALFDLDGTLTDTNEVDVACFVGALKQEFGFRDVNPDWGSYRHTTDPGIAIEAFERVHQRPPGTRELERLRARFVSLLSEVMANDSTQFQPIPGAGEFLQCLAREREIAVGIATGAWRASATLKLDAARLRIGDTPIATGDDGISRIEIVRHAIQDAQRHYGVRRFTSVVSFGDGPWDLRAARELRLGFVGIGRAEAARRLRSAGAEHVIADYTDITGVLRTMDQNISQPRGRERADDRAT